MVRWNPSPLYRKVAEANRQFYLKAAHLYESTETCVTDAQAQRMLEMDIERVLKLCDQPAQHVRALDACAGSGNVSLKLLRRGVDVTTCDISLELLAILRAKCEEQGLQAKIVCAEIGEFLDQQRGVYDLIVFSSALHHLEDIEGVLALAYASLRSGGLLFTVFDPTARVKRSTRLAVWLDYMLFKMHKQPADLLAALLRRSRRMVQALRQGRPQTKQDLGLDDANLGVLAEYHVEQGIDDLALVEHAQQLGFTVLWHERYNGTRYLVTQQLLNLLGDRIAFKLLLRKD